MNKRRIPLTFLKVFLLCFVFSGFAQSSRFFTTDRRTFEQLENYPTPTPTPITVDITPDPDRIKLTPPRELTIPEISNLAFGASDVDCDGIKNSADNCPIVFNPDQKDKNKNNVGDFCEGVNEKLLDLRCDNDKDGVIDERDNCPLVCNPDQTDKNKNGFGDVCDSSLLTNWVRYYPCKKKQKKVSTQQNLKKQVRAAN